MGYPRYVHRAIRVEDVHWREVGPDHLLDRVVNYGHSWCLRDSRVSCCQVYPLQGILLIQIYATPSDMGEACLPHVNIVIELHL
jgi:hypothetical protein